MKSSKTIGLIASLASCAFLTGEAGQQVERPFKMKGHGILVISLIDGSCQSVQIGLATHTGKFVNEYSGYFDFETTTYFSADGINTAANGDQLYWTAVSQETSGNFTGGTGRFQGATGLFGWEATDIVSSIDPISMTATLEYNFTGSGTVKY